MIVFNKKILASVLFILISLVGMATQMDGPPPPVAQGAPIPPGLPIDNGLIILASAAIIYGIYRILKFYKTQNQA